MDEKNEYNNIVKNKDQHEDHSEYFYNENCDTEEVVSIGKWLATYLILAIPFVNIIMLIVWIVSKKTNKNIKNSLIASLIIFAIMLLFSFVFMPYGY